jgi:hypothetical protein
LFDLDEGAARVPPLPGLTGAPSELLRRHLERNARLELSDNAIVDKTAQTCRSLLNRPIVVDAHGTVFRVAVSAFNAASGQDVPSGAMGSCAVGVAGGNDAVRLSGRMSLRRALDFAVAQVRGVVWLAVEGADGTCGVGLYSRDALRMHRPEVTSEDAFCMMQIGKVR